MEPNQIEPSQSKWGLLLLIGVGIIVLFIIVGGFHFYSRNSDNKILNTENYGYHLQTQYDAEKSDQILIRRNEQTGEEIVIVDSIKKAIPELNKNPNLFLRFFAYPKDSKAIVFKIFLDGRDNPAGALYLFDTETNRFMKMKVNDIYDGFFGGFAISPDQRKLAWIPDAEDESGKAQTLYLIDLVGDEYEIAVNLSANETFNGGRFAMSSHFELNWLDNQKIKYAVFDQSKKQERFDPYDNVSIKTILIGYREYDYDDAGSVSVTSPNGGETYEIGDRYVLENQLDDILVSLDLGMKSSNIVTVNLNNGEYKYKSANCSTGLCYFILYIDASKYIDVDNDKDLDALVPANHWNGGNKTLGSIEVFINNNGNLKHIGGISTGVGTGANWLKAENNIITVNYDAKYNGVAGWSDPTTFVYKIQGENLILINKDQSSGSVSTENSNIKN